MQWKLPVPCIRNVCNGNQRIISNKLIDVWAVLWACFYLHDLISQNGRSLERPILVLMGKLSHEEGMWLASVFLAPFRDHTKKLCYFCKSTESVPDTTGPKRKEASSCSLCNESTLHLPYLLVTAGERGKSSGLRSLGFQPHLLYIMLWDSHHLSDNTSPAFGAAYKRWWMRNCFANCGTLWKPTQRLRLILPQLRSPDVCRGHPPCSPQWGWPEPLPSTS